MKKCSTCKEYKELKEFSKRSDRPSQVKSSCKICRNSERHIWYKQNKDKVTKTNKKYKLKHKVRLAVINKIHSASWAKNNPDKLYLKQTKRRMAKLKRLPKWLTKSDWIEIKWSYAESKRLSKETGIKYEVDHIIPLQGINISGLHCPQNLRIITKSENASKKNYFDVK